MSFPLDNAVIQQMTTFKIIIYIYYYSRVIYFSHQRCEQTENMNTFRLVWLPFLLEIVACSECPDIYRRYSDDHIFCMNSTCKVEKQGISEHEKKVILDIHNKARSKVATGKETEHNEYPPATNMMQMEWDDELAAIAQKEANLCDFSRQFSPSQRATGHVQPGVLKFKVTGLNQIYWERILVNDWLSKIKNFFPDYIKPYFFQSTYGLFTQMIWAKTWKIGCGAALYEKTKVFYICYYGPAGNMENRAVYEKGPECSECPKNTNCSDEYKGLCKSLSSMGPLKERIPDEDVFFYCDFGTDDPKECSDKQLTGATFTNNETIGGVYKTAMLNGGEHIELNIGKFKHDLGICPFIIIRNGPNDAAISFKFNGVGNVRSTGKNGIWRPIAIHMMSPMQFETKIIYEVEKGQTLQYLDINGFGVGKGKCPHFNMI